MNEEWTHSGDSQPTMTGAILGESDELEGGD